MSIDDRLQAAGIRPTAQRAVIASLLFGELDHPSADEVFKAVCMRSAHVSQATVYNTLHAFVEAGLLQEVQLGAGRVVYDSNVEPHHHFIDDGSSAIIDVDLNEVTLSAECKSKFDIEAVQVVIRGTLKNEE